MSWTVTVAPPGTLGWPLTVSTTMTEISVRSAEADPPTSGSDGSLSLGQVALPGGTGWVFEPKWDGYRASVTVTLDRLRIESRRGTNLTALFPEVARGAEAELSDLVVLDAELVIFQDGRLSFDSLQERMARGSKAARQLATTAPASLMVFDMLSLDSADLRRLPWAERRGRLEQLGADWQPPIQITPYTDDRATAAEWMDSLAPMGIEGIVAKRSTARYGTAGAWAKVKYRETLEGVVGAVVGPLARPEALIIGTIIDNELRVLGRTPALTAAQAAEVGQLLRPPAGDHPWPTTLAAGHYGGDPVVITHAEPAVIVEVSADAAQQGGRRRHPLRLIRVRYDTGP